MMCMESRPAISEAVPRACTTLPSIQAARRMETGASMGIPGMTACFTVFGGGDVAASGMPEAYYDLYSDTREDNPMLIPMIHTQGQFNRMRARHELMKRKYPDKKKAYGIPYTGLSNARPETKAIADQVTSARTCLRTAAFSTQVAPPRL